VLTLIGTLDDASDVLLLEPVELDDAANGSSTPERGVEDRAPSMYIVRILDAG
jgi:hypothetical protein